MRLVRLFCLIVCAWAANSVCHAADSKQREEPNEIPLDLPTPTVPTNPDHVLGPQDVIRVQVFRENDITRQCDQLVISQNRTVTLPLLGAVDVSGKTVREFEKLVHDRYDRDYFVNPQVSVLMLKYADRMVNVVGSVTKQGRISFPTEQPLSIVDAIALAGGQTRLADLAHVKLNRLNDKGERETREVDVNAMMKKDGIPPVMLEPEDVIYVPERVL